MEFSQTPRLIHCRRITRAGIGMRRTFACQRCGMRQPRRGERRRACSGRLRWARKSPGTFLKSGAGTPDDAKLIHVLATPGLLDEARAELGEYRGGIDATTEGDESRGKYAAWILEKKRPGLLPLHLTAVDHIEHETGVFSADAIAVLERLDAVSGQVRAAAEKSVPGLAYVA